MTAAPAGSLLLRVFWRVGLTMFAAVALVAVVLVVELRNRVDTLRDRSLNGQAADMSRHVSRAADGEVRVRLPPGLAAAYAADHGRYRYAVLDARGKLLAGSTGVSGALDEPALVRGPGVHYFSNLDVESGRRFFGASLAVQRPGGWLVVQVQQGEEHEDVLVDTLLDELAEEGLWSMALVFGAILLVTYWTLRGALSSLTEASRQAAAIGPEHLDRRLPESGVPSEIRPLIRAVNAALDRVEAAFEQQRRFTSDAAHEMRTPIAVLRAHLQNLDAPPARELERDLVSLERVVSQLLKLAQADSMVVASGSQVDLHRVAVDTAALMAPGAIARGRTVAVSGDREVRVAGDEGAVQVALRNLVENALNLSPAGGEVEIRVARDGPRLQVLDRGPGVLRADRERIFERFWRGERAQGPGAGLGLSIVGRIAAAHGAVVTVADRDGGGSVFELRFGRMALA